MNIEELNNELDTQTQNLQILQVCLNHINSVMQSTDTYDNANEITELLRDVKVNLDNTRGNITDLKNIQKTAMQFNNSWKSYAFTENTTNQSYKSISNDLPQELTNRIF